jgi:PPK2 family polyphosphate:nucleotide phosphotransferase
MKGILQNISTQAPNHINREETATLFDELVLQMQYLQGLLYAESKRSLLIILQGMDASGKDSTVKHVFGQINPMGIRVKSFKKPTPEEYSYDFFRRVHKHTPPKGMIHIFNRSHYEDVLVPAVHKLLPDEKINRRLGYINAFESMLHDHDTIILKFFLHISKEEQTRRFKRRLTNPNKLWKYDPSDIAEAKNWNLYSSVYETIFKKCSPQFPWIIIPSDDKWYRNYLIAKEIVDYLKTLPMKYPKGYFEKHQLTKEEIDKLLNS